MNTSLDYLQTLYGKATYGDIVLIKDCRNKVAATFKPCELEQCAAFIESYTTDLFIKVNVMDHNKTLTRSQFGIGGTAEVEAIVSFHLDVDAGKDDRYLTRENMLEAIDKMPCEPSMIIETNGDAGGFHAYWILEEPHYIVSEDDRNELGRISTAWLEQLRRHASPGTIDGTANLDRILRPVGSLRVKSGNRVRVFKTTNKRYRLSDFILPEPETPKPIVEYTANDGESIIDQYLDSIGLNTPEAILTQQSYSRVNNVFWTRPGSQSGQPTGEVFRANGKFGFTVKSGAADPLSNMNPNGTSGRWYSCAALYVAFHHGNDWKRAAAFCYGEIEASKPKVDIDNFMPEEKPKTDKQTNDKPNPSKPNPVSVSQLWKDNKTMRLPIVHGLLREGETCNVIASPKVGKSFLAGGLAWSIAAGRSWMGFETMQGNVLIIDNELHTETLSKRLSDIAEGMEVDPEHYVNVDVLSLRGVACGVQELRGFGIESGRYSLIVIDALYRTLPEGTSENDNAQMMAVYNHLDRLAAGIGAAIVVVHHSSKGDQSGKSLTDVGSGAGAISRAADTHLIIRSHEQEGFQVLEAVTRSFKSPEPVTIQFQYPLWKSSEVEPVVKRANGVPKQEATDLETREDVAKALGTKWKTEQDVRNATGFGAARVRRGFKLLGAKEKRVKSKKTGKPSSVFSLPIEIPKGAEEWAP